MSKGCFYIISMIVINLILVLILGINEISQSVNSLDILKINDCNEPPCLFGQSLQGKNYEQVDAILERSPLTRDTTIVHPDNATLNWNWSDVLSARLQSMQTPYFYNSVNFREGVAHSVELLFTIRLNELIDIWGEPDTIRPYTYARGYMEIILSYEESSSYFGVLTSCKEPKLYPDSFVGYYISTAPDSMLASTRSEMPWTGYTNNLPDCTIFQP